MYEQLIQKYLPIKVLVWSPRGAGLHYGGPSMNVYRLLNAARSDRLKASLVHTFDGQKRMDIFHEQYMLRPNQSKYNQLLFMLKALTWLRSHASNYDVFYGVEGFHITIKPALTAEQMGLPAFVFLAAYRSDLADKSGLKKLLGFPQRRREMVKKLSGIIAISSAIFDELIEYGIPEEKIVRIPIGVDTDYFSPVTSDQERLYLREQLGWRNLPTLVFVGAINRRKQPHLLVEALGLLHKRGIEAQLALVGPEQDKQYSQMIRGICDEMNLANHIIWHGFTTDVAPVFKAADIYSLVSRNEGMPSALVEAMSTGLPSIVTSISGTTELISDGINGRIVSSDAHEIADALQEYLTDSALARIHGAAAREKIMAQFSLKAVVNAHERMFQIVLAGGNAADASIL